MSLFSDALSSGFSAIQDVAGEPIVYAFGSSSIAITAVVGQTEFEDVQSDGEIRTLVKSVDFLIKPSDLRFGDDPVEPAKGAKITWRSQEFVLMPGLDTHAWRWSDGLQTHYRVHTVRKGVL